MSQLAWPRTSVELIMAAREQGQAIVDLADGDAHVLPDVICRHNGCDMAYDSRNQRWSKKAANVRTRDLWRYGNCPEHDA